MPRPQAIVLFERFYLASLALGALNSLLSLPKMSAALAQDPQTRAVGMGAGTIVFTLVATLAINLLVWFYAARRASNSARWIYIALLILGLLFIPGAIRASFAVSAFGPAGTIVPSLLQVAGGVCLFLPAAREWFAAGRPGANDGPDTRG